MTIPPSPAQPSAADMLSQYVGRTAAALQTGYQADSSDAVATLARLRKVVPTGPHLDPEIWDIFDGMPSELLGRGDDPSRAEYAAVAALTLFATHQQSRRDAGMHQPGRAHSLGRAIAQLARARDGQGVERRFRALTRAGHVTASLQHLRGLVNQLRNERIPLDYGDLARDLHRLQHPEGLHGVRMRWTRDFHRPLRDDEPRPETSTTELTGDQP